MLRKNRTHFWYFKISWSKEKQPVLDRVLLRLIIILIFSYRLSLCQTHILEGLSSIRAASVPSRSQEFQVQYLKCRSEFLQALSQIVYTCHSLRTSPPPAIAGTQVIILNGLKFRRRKVQFLKIIMFFFWYRQKQLAMTYKDVDELQDFCGTVFRTYLQWQPLLVICILRALTGIRILWVKFILCNIYVYVYLNGLKWCVWKVVVRELFMKILLLHFLQTLLKVHIQYIPMYILDKVSVFILWTYLYPNK